MKTIHEYVETLIKQTPNDMDNYWMVCPSQNGDCVLYLHKHITININELKNRTDSEIKILIREKIINILNIELKKRKESLTQQSNQQP